MLARAMVGLLPPLEVEEAITVNQIHSVANRSNRPASGPRAALEVRTTRFQMWPWSAVDPILGPVKSAWPMAGSCF